MFVVGGLLCTTILALLLAALFGDLPVHIAWPLASGFSCLGIGLLTFSWPRLMRRLDQPMQATRAARAQPSATTRSLLTGLAFVIVGSIAIWATLASLIARV